MGKATPCVVERLQEAGLASRCTHPKPDGQSPHTPTAATDKAKTVYPQSAAFAHRPFLPDCHHSDVLASSHGSFLNDSCPLVRPVLLFSPLRPLSSHSPRRSHALDNDVVRRSRNRHGTFCHAPGVSSHLSSQRLPGCRWLLDASLSCKTQCALHHGRPAGRAGPSDA